MWRLSRDEYMHDEGPVWASYIDGLSDTIAHVHDFTEMVIVMKGFGKHIIKGKSYPLRDGQVFVIPVGTEHAYEGTDTVSLHNVLFELPEMGDLEKQLLKVAGIQALLEVEPVSAAILSDERGICLSAQELSDILECVRTMEDELQSRNTGYQLKVIASFIDLMVKLSRIYEERHNDNANRHVTLGRVLAWLNENYSNEICLNDMAYAASVSPSTLIRQFKAIFGTTPGAYIIDYRLRKAANFLSNGAKVYEAAYLSGFSDPDYMAKIFRKRFGVSPREYAKCNSNN
ncbi:MAG: helix-turn-helix domain-containing protein [Armatimonadota bacterium]